jgi:uncharacterized membrane protein
MTTRNHDDFWQRPVVQFAGMALIALATGAAFWIADGFTEAIVPFLILLAFALVVWLGRERSQTLATISGLGDERTRTLNQRAIAFCGNVMANVIAGWWLVTVALGDPNETLTILAALFGLCYIGAAVVFARRG